MRCRIVAAVLFLAPALVSNAFAQSYDNPTVGQSPVVEHPQDYKPLGIRAGSIMVHPGIELAAEFNDNILFTHDNTLSDEIRHVRPYVTAQSTWSRHSVSARLAADIARYADNSFRDYEDYFLQVGGHIDVKLQSKFSYGLDSMELHEERNVRSAEQGIGPTNYTLTGGNLGYDHTFNRLSLGLAYTPRSLSYDNTQRLDGSIIDNSDRDRTEQTYSARFGYQLTTGKQVFAKVGLTDVEYDQKFDRNGFDSSSDGFFLDAGMDWQLTGVLKGDAYVSYNERSYDDPNLADIDGWGPGAGLTWRPTKLTTVRGTINTSIEDTTQSTASGYQRTLYSVRVDHELLRNLQINGQLSYYENDYELLPDAPEFAREEDTVRRVGVGVTYFVNRSVWISASYDFTDFSSNIPNDDYESNVAWLVLGLER
jgi:hypothetical protein